MQKAEVSSDKEILKHEVGRLAALWFFLYHLQYARNMPILFVS